MSEESVIDSLPFHRDADSGWFYPDDLIDMKRI